MVIHCGNRCGVVGVNGNHGPNRAMNRKRYNVSISAHRKAREAAHRYDGSAPASPRAPSGRMAMVSICYIISNFVTNGLHRAPSSSFPNPPPRPPAVPRGRFA
ncbi:hypothetical protein BURPS1106B_2670 [Burkholderia pseudomallei 1106b]|uniref:Uncharacterized protein n=2 Tax=Burkholderia pseudomallei TaxID=28450 RepID=A0AAX0UEN8_BURPE|nr:hypothetical protein BURPS1106A_A2506 [Burkholderia pseudomallei 1106a]ARL54977.1 hypothetical protein BOC51_22550 [Burkholderia pseudomallei]EES21370.1 hypothetical protein BURPS1106B_2670 [Burkholderia pseudomallei 1106b]PNX05639.1 hypothetical protein CF649_05030 [Burkholderia sp. 136(2017)]PNX18188.1 hypothetical protein CF650_01460 [Burkholderia sp. 129]PNX32545.1 hypothetical protein CF647_04935 [Burkholderia sp. 117]PNX41498.1 hypothetical protein CF648_05030 [Burkholderia sp. 137]